MEKLYLGTNTKMYKNIAQTSAFLHQLKALTQDLPRDNLELFVIPSFTALERAKVCAGHIRIGAQNLGWEDEGQFSGEISPLMLREVGIDLVMIGHSERRHILLETDEMERRKVACALRHGITPLLCVGETGEQKELGISDEILAAQVKIALHGLTPEQAARVRIAYEPVWAIGVGGIPATADYASQRHQQIRAVLAALFGAETAAQIPLLYGGSVNPENAVELSRMPDIDGLFIGRSAWDAARFNGIIRDVLAAR